MYHNYRRTSNAQIVGMAAGITVLMLLVGVVLSALFGLIAAIPLYFLWNWLMPDIFSLPTISYWQAWGLYLLAAILFKSSSSASGSSKKD